MTKKQLKKAFLACAIATLSIVAPNMASAIPITEFQTPELGKSPFDSHMKLSDYSLPNLHNLVFGDSHKYENLFAPRRPDETDKHFKRRKTRALFLARKRLKHLAHQWDHGQPHGNPPPIPTPYPFDPPSPGPYIPPGPSPVPAVPEPSTLVLLASGLGGLLAYRGREFIGKMSGRVFKLGGPNLS